MNKDEQTFATAKAQLQDLWESRARFQGRDEKPALEWMTDCISITSFLLDNVKEIDATDVLVTLALGMWQAGYEAAPSLQFVLPEGVAG